jgi:L-threonine-O-3-phosphate decarboxylase
LAELHHGGRLREAASCYGIPPGQWLDLSTGINPVGWPVPPLPAACWQRLPEADDGLERAAADYYGAAHLLPVAGSQAAIQALPQLRPACRVGVLAASYAEHAAAWQRQGHELVALEAGAIPRLLPGLDVLLLVNPNNPTGESFSPEQLLAWHAALAARGGWLVVDEAFMDATPERSIARYSGVPGLVVLRSLGKFFGLAGARVGFALAWPQLLRELAARLGPWAVSGPAREAARLALADRAWQAEARLRLLQDGERLQMVLAHHDLVSAGGTALFRYCPTAPAAALHEALARQGVLTRLFAAPAALRFGLPGDEAAWRRLELALTALPVNATQKKVAKC